MKKLNLFVFGIAVLFLVSTLNAFAADIFSQINYGLNQYDRMMNTAGRIDNVRKDYSTQYQQYQQQTQPSPQPAAQQYTQPYQPQYSQSQPQQVPSSPYKYTNTQVYQGAAATLADLPSGTIVIDPKALWKYTYSNNYIGEPVVEAPVFWNVFEHGHYKDGATLLVSEYFVAQYDFNHINKPMGNWVDSDVRRWLRTTFYKHLSPAFKNAIVTVDAPSVNMKNQPYKSNENVFLLSIVEWGLSDRANNGKVVNNPYLTRELVSGTVGFYKAGNLMKLDKNKSMPYGTRTINIPQAGGFQGKDKDFFVISNGLLEATKYNYSFNNKIRPAVNIKSSTPVSGPHTMTYFVDKTLTYYVLELPEPASAN